MSFVPPTVGTCATSGLVQNVVRPTMREVAPSAISECVSLGTNDTTRWGGCTNTSVRPRSSVSLIAGTVYVDSNGNGAFDASDARMAGITLTLTGTNGRGQAITRGGA